MTNFMTIEKILYAETESGDYQIFVKSENIDLPGSIATIFDTDKPTKADFDHKYCGSCIFCLCQCPVCGSLDVILNYDHKQICNDSKNYLKVEPADVWFDNKARVFCKDCHSGTVSDKLKKWLDENQDVNEYEINDSGEIDCIKLG